MKRFLQRLPQVGRDPLTETYSSQCRNGGNRVIFVQLEAPQFAYVFTGKVYPERIPIDDIQLIQQLHHPEAGLEGELKVVILASQLTITFWTHTKVDDLATLKNICVEVARVAVDIEGYRSGAGYDVDVIQVVLPGGEGPIVFGKGMEALRQRTSLPDYPDFLAALNAPGGDALRIALADFRWAIRTPKDSGFFCYRAVEALRQVFQSESGRKRDSWDDMREALLIPREDLLFLKAKADAVRHGKSPFISGAEREQALKVTSTIINKAVRYLKDLGAGGSSPPFVPSEMP